MKKVRFRWTKVDIVDNGWRATTRFENSYKIIDGLKERFVQRNGEDMVVDYETARRYCKMLNAGHEYEGLINA